MNLKRIAEIIKKLFCLSPVPTLLIAVPSFGLVIYVLSNTPDNEAVTYIAYLLSAYALIISVTGMTGIVKWLQNGINNHPVVRKVLGIPMVDRYLKEVMFRTEASLYQGLFINLLYAGIKLFSGILYRSVWFVSLAVYYIFLAAMRFSLLHYVKSRGKAGEDRISELKRCRLCGIILLFMNEVLVGIIILVVHENSGFEYPGTLIYAMAAYAFYAIIVAVRNVIKYRKYGSPIMSSAKVISLTAALVSMLSLETAMLTQFGAAEDAAFRRFMTSVTGGAVSMIMLAMAVFMIARATMQLKKINGKGDTIHDSYTRSGG